MLKTSAFDGFKITLFDITFFIFFNLMILGQEAYPTVNLSLTCTGFSNSSITATA